MNVSKQPAFYYHADANALGGVLTQPLCRVVTTNASVSLAQAGGFGAAQDEKFHVDKLISADAAHVRVSGNEQPDHRGYRTIATAIVEGLNVLEVVTADRIVAQASLFHPYDHGPVQLSLLGTQFVNLKINGQPVEPTFDKRMLGVPEPPKTPPVDTVAVEPAVDKSLLTAPEPTTPVETVTAAPPETDSPLLTNLIKVAQAQFEENAIMRRTMMDKLGARFSFIEPAADLARSGTALCSLVQTTKAEQPSTCYGHVIVVPDFGIVYLGELLLTPFAAELTMLRIELGCMAAGTVSSASLRSNGRWMP